MELVVVKAEDFGLPDSTTVVASGCDITDMDGVFGFFHNKDFCDSGCAEPGDAGDDRCALMDPGAYGERCFGGSKADYILRIVFSSKDFGLDLFETVASRIRPERFGDVITENDW